MKMLFDRNTRLFWGREKILPCTLVCLLVLGVCTALLAEIRFSGSVSAMRISQDDQLVLTLEAAGKDVSNNMAEPQCAGLEDFRIVDKNASMSSSSSFRVIINGRDMSQESEKKVTWRFVMAPKKAGSLTIPPFVLNYQGKTYQTNAATIEVGKGAVENQDVVFQCIPQKRRVYLGEQFRCIFRIAIRRGANAFNPRRPMVEDELRKSFWVETLAKAEIRGRQEMIGGVAYEVFDIPFALYPVQAGKITIPSFALQYEQRQQVRRSDPFDDPFFSGFFGGGVQATAKQKNSAPVEITVLDLPSASGASSGGVGEFRMNAKIDRTNLAAGEAVTYTLVLEGNSSMRNVSDPQVPAINGFDVFEPEKKTQTRVQNNQVWGSREYKYVMIPQREGQFTIQPAAFTYFDVNSGTYKTLTTKPFSVSATPGKRMAGIAPDRPLLGHTEIKQLGSDIRFIKSGGVRIASAGKPLYRNPWFLALQLVPVLGVAGSFWLSRQRRRLARDAGYARKLRSRKMVRKRLADAKRFLEAGNAKDFYAALSKGIVDYVGDVLNISATGMTTDILSRHLLEAGQEEALVQDVLTLLEKADFARFATSSVEASDMSADFDKTESLLNRFRLGRGKL